MIVTEHLLNHFKDITKEFLYAMRDGDYDRVWNHLITIEAANLLATMAFPLLAYDRGQIDQLLTIIPNTDIPINIENGLALAFQVDKEGIRSSTFSGMASNFGPMGWYDIKDETSIAFAEENFGVLIAETAGIDLVMPVIKSGDIYKVDFEALAVFSMFFSAAKIYRIGLRAVEIGRTDAAMVYFETATSLSKPLYRLRKILVDHPLTHMMVKEPRKQELREEETAVLMARDQVLRMMAAMDVKAKRVDIGRFLEETFHGYKDILNTSLDEEERSILQAMNDSDLRKAIAQILRGVNSIEAQREAEKPHSPAEVADMEIKVHIDGERYLLCLPFKSSVEIRSETVPVDIAYQIIRPFMYFPNCIVVFITAKPCSQYLMNYIKLASETQGWSIEVIQDKELGKLLKVNGLLHCEEAKDVIASNFGLSPDVDDLESKRKLLRQYQSNLNKLRLQAATYAHGETPLHLQNNIEREEERIAELKAELGYDS